MKRAPSLPLAASILLLTASCGKKNDPQIPSHAEVRLNTSFLGNTGGYWLRSYQPEDCTGTVSIGRDWSFPSTESVSFTFVADAGDASQTTISLDRSKLKSGMVGTYELESDFHLTLEYQKVASSSSVSTTDFSGRSTPRTLTISAYNPFTKLITGTFDVVTPNQWDPAGQPTANVTARGSVEVSGTFSNLPLFE